VLFFKNAKKNNKQLVITNKQELAADETKLVSLEEKWITNKIDHETYNRWFADINRKRTELKLMIERLSATSRIFILVCIRILIAWVI
jgi:site-specific DNA recombinase